MNKKHEKSLIFFIPVGPTRDLQPMRHATRDMGRYCKILKDIFSFNPIQNRIEKYQIILKTIESNKKENRIT